MKWMYLKDYSCQISGKVLQHQAWDKLGLELFNMQEQNSLRCQVKFLLYFKYFVSFFELFKITVCTYTYEIQNVYAQITPHSSNEDSSKKGCITNVIL